MKRILLLLTSLTLLTITYAQNLPQNIKISIPAKVKIVFSDNFSVKIKDSTSSKLYVLLFDSIESLDTSTNISDIQIVNQNNTLIIRSAVGAVNYFDILPEITIQLPQLNTVLLKSAGQVFITGSFDLKHLTIINDGAGYIAVDNLVKIQNLHVDNRGAGIVVINSKFPIAYAKINVSGLGMFSAPHTPIANLDAQISGASYCNIFVTDNLIAKVTGLSVLDYSGRPKYKKIISQGLVIINQKSNPKLKTL